MNFQVNTGYILISVRVLIDYILEQFTTGIQTERVSGL